MGRGRSKVKKIVDRSKQTEFQEEQKIATKTPESAMNSAISNVTNLPELQGSKKQIDWAESIRSNALESLNSLARETMIAGRNTLSGETYFNDLTPDRERTLDAIKSVRNSITNILGTVTSAGTIIDNRHSMSSGARESTRMISDIMRRADRTGKDLVTQEKIDRIVRMSFLPGTL